MTVFEEQSAGEKAPEAGAEPKRRSLRSFVAARATRLQEAYREDNATAVAQLAKLRRGVNQSLGADLELVGLTTVGLYPDDVHLRDEPTNEEQAAYAAITLFALHQQGKRGLRMHQNGYSFGRSARLLGRKAGSRDAVRRRFNAMGTAITWAETLHHARGLIQQFRAHDIPLDYGRFAADLYRLHRPDLANAVRNAWGRDFYRTDQEDTAGEFPASDKQGTD
ncbi:type I-E CRISPR-associated protein Cse2/CasB [Saxibacter everestensis]|uniref:Type I-E CRISPR-associated protein Cse2/CasB n=1 Tax=Saxibacter everestensis TaxID=2909229 RepID=A0ABY8QQM2_9MICO|nr:type I-E CRISPR-associated protein Cse2/CasB [Brevibacteriaceae bacterium ZFBP1038]